jgi:hypothetical protein
MTRKCSYRKSDGAPCDADAQISRNVCVFHDPERANDGIRARRAGGIRRSRRTAVLPLNTPDHPLGNSSDICSLLAETTNQLRRGQLDPKVATAIGYLASVQLRGFEQGALERRMKAIEDNLGVGTPAMILNAVEDSN